jgi:hypothetical protein
VVVEKCPIEFEDSRNKFLSLVNRGGLITPSDLIYLCCLEAAKLQKCILNDFETEQLFISFSDHRSIFSGLLAKRIENSGNLGDIFSASCNSGHPFYTFIPTIANKFFHVVIKNFMSERNDAIHASRKRAVSDGKEKKCQLKKKCQKLSSNSF